MSATLCKHGNPLVECTDEMCCLIYERTPVIPAPAEEEPTPDEEWDLGPTIMKLDADRAAAAPSASEIKLPTDELRCATCGWKENAVVHHVKGLKASHDFVAPESLEHQLSALRAALSTLQAQQEELRTAATHVADELTDLKGRVGLQLGHSTLVYLSQLIGVLRDPSKLSRSSLPSSETQP